MKYNYHCIKEINFESDSPSEQYGVSVSSDNHTFVCITGNDKGYAEKVAKILGENQIAPEKITDFITNIK